MALTVSAPALEYVGTYDAKLKAPLQAGGPFGSRMIFEVVSGSFSAASGERGTLLTGGADWLLVGPDGWGRLDVRAQVQMADGAILYVQYFGLIEMNDRVMSALQNGTATSFDQQYFRTTPRFETSDPRYAWLQQGVFVGQGRIIEGVGVEYNVFRVT
jgi:hypothetical protein